MCTLKAGHTAPASFKSAGFVVLLVGWPGAATLVGGLCCKVSPESAYKIEDNKPVVLKGTLRPLAMTLSDAPGLFVYQDGTLTR